MKLALCIAIAFFSSSGLATSVKPHVTKSGTYVQGHQRTAPDKTKTNNYGSKPNVNPYTGKPGTVDPYKPRK